MFERHPPPLYDIVRLGGGLRIRFCVPPLLRVLQAAGATKSTLREREGCRGARQGLAHDIKGERTK